MKKIKIWISFFSVFLLSGCYNYRELTDIVITSALGISKTENGYMVTMQIINTQKTETGSAGGSNQPKFIVYQKEGKTLQEAFRNVVLESPRRLFVNHISLLVIDENLAREGIKNVLDIFARDTEFRKQFLVVVSKNSDKNILETQTPLETINAKSIQDSITADLNYLGVAKEITLELLLERYINDKKEIVIPTVIMQGNASTGENVENLEETDSEARVLIDSLAVFKEDKMIGTLSLEESIAANYIDNEIKNTIISHQCEDGNYMAIEVIDSKTKNKVSKKNDKISISIQAKANINEINCAIDLTKNKNITKLEKEIGAQLKKEIEGTIHTVQNTYNSDIFGFQELIYKTDPKYFYSLKDETDDNVLKKLQFEVDVNIQLIAKGNLVKVIENAKKQD